MSLRSRCQVTSLGIGVALLFIAGPACLSTQTQTSLDGSRGDSPVVEAFIEYPGPQERWMGPASFLLHVVAKEKGPAVITATPPLLVAEGTPDPAPEPNVISRVPASAAGMPGLVPTKLSSDEAREMLGHLATAINGVAAPFKACMYPVRVRLVRLDGALLDKQGCRSEFGWSRAVSEVTNVFMGN